VCPDVDRLRPDARSPLPVGLGRGRPARRCRERRRPGRRYIGKAGVGPRRVPHTGCRCRGRRERIREAAGVTRPARGCGGRRDGDAPVDECGHGRGNTDASVEERRRDRRAGGLGLAAYAPTVRRRGKSHDGLRHEVLGTPAQGLTTRARASGRRAARPAPGVPPHAVGAPKGWCSDCGVQGPRWRARRACATPRHCRRGRPPTRGARRPSHGERSRHPRRRRARQPREGSARRRLRHVVLHPLSSARPRTPPGAPECSLPGPAPGFPVGAARKSVRPSEAASLCLSERANATHGFPFSSREKFWVEPSREMRNGWPFLTS
jgi:hypothetical protein